MRKQFELYYALRISRTHNITRIQSFQRLHTDPNASEILYPGRLYSECRFQRTNDHFFECSKVQIKTHIVAAQAEYRVYNKLQSKGMIVRVKCIFSNGICSRKKVRVLFAA